MLAGGAFSVALWGIKLNFFNAFQWTMDTSCSASHALLSFYPQATAFSSRRRAYTSPPPWIIIHYGTCNATPRFRQHPRTWEYQVLWRVFITQRPLSWPVQAWCYPWTHPKTIQGWDYSILWSRVSKWFGI